MFSLTSSILSPSSSLSSVVPAGLVAGVDAVDNSVRVATVVGELELHVIAPVSYTHLTLPTKA